MRKKTFLTINLRKNINMDNEHDSLTVKNKITIDVLLKSVYQFH